MSNDTKVIVWSTVGTGVGIVSVLLWQIGTVNTRIDDFQKSVGSEIRTVNTRIDDFRDTVGKNIAAVNTRIDDFRNTVSEGIGTMNTTIERVEKHLSERIDDVRDRVAVNRPADQGAPNDEVLAAPTVPSGGGGGGGGGSGGSIHGDCFPPIPGPSLPDTNIDPPCP